MTYELRASATRDEEKVDICYERSGGYIEFDLLELLCCTSASYQVSRMNAPPHGPHAVPCAAPLLEPVDPPPRDLSFHSRNHFSSLSKQIPLALLHPSEVLTGFISVHRPCVLVPEVAWSGCPPAALLTRCARVVPLSYQPPRVPGGVEMQYPSFLGAKMASE
jgi:hypothetical protein